MSTNGNKTVIFPGVKDGDTFEVAGIEFIKFPSKGGMTPVLSKEILFHSSFGEDNDFRKSKILKQFFWIFKGIAHIENKI